MPGTNPVSHETVTLLPDFSRAQRAWEQELAVRLPLRRAPYILATLALSQRGGDRNPFEEKTNALNALINADNDGTLQPPLSGQLRNEMQVWQNTYNDRIANPEHRLPYRPLEFLLAWAVDHGSQPDQVVEKPSFKSGSVPLKGLM